MTLLAPHLTAFLAERLPRERGASVHTCDTYAYAFKLLVTWAAARFGTTPAALTLEQLDASCLLAFLEHLEVARKNSARSRNARLAALKSFARFVEYRVPACLEQVRRILAIPMKKADAGLVGYLTRAEMQALLDAPDLLRPARKETTSPRRGAQKFDWISSKRRRVRAPIHTREKGPTDSARTALRDVCGTRAERRQSAFIRRPTHEARGRRAHPFTTWVTPWTTQTSGPAGDACALRAGSSGRRS